MALYYMNIRRRTELVLDEEGNDFSSVTEAHMAAIAALCEIAGDSLKGLSDVSVLAIEITRADGTVIRTVTMVEAVSPFFSDAADQAAD